MIKCEHCGSNNVKFHLSVDDNSVHLCSNCYNKSMTEELNVALEPLVETFSLKDYQGISRTFYVERRIDPMGIFLEAVENIEFGYKFAVHEELNANQIELLTKLIKKTRKGIEEQHVVRGIFPNGQEYYSITNGQIKGLIEYDENSEGSPLIIIDGKPFTWKEIGKMIMSYEGFQIKLEMFDFTDDVE
jgi:hypothetical protein